MILEERAEAGSGLPPFAIHVALGRTRCGLDERDGREPRPSIPVLEPGRADAGGSSGFGKILHCAHELHPAFRWKTKKSPRLIQEG